MGDSTADTGAALVEADAAEGAAAADGAGVAEGAREEAFFGVAVSVADCADGEPDCSAELAADKSAPRVANVHASMSAATAPKVSKG